MEMFFAGMKSSYLCTQKGKIEAVDVQLWEMESEYAEIPK